MTGSRRAFNYQADDGQNYGVVKDESAAEATVGGTVLFGNFTNGTANLPCGIRKRYVNAVLDTDSSIRRKFEVGNRLLFNSITNGTKITEAAGGLAAGGVYSVTNKVGEKARFLTANDTGQIDGDNP